MKKSHHSAFSHSALPAFSESEPAYRRCRQAHARNIQLFGILIIVMYGAIAAIMLQAAIIQ